MNIKNLLHTKKLKIGIQNINSVTVLDYLSTSIAYHFLSKTFIYALATLKMQTLKCSNFVNDALLRWYLCRR